MLFLEDINIQTIYNDRKLLLDLIRAFNKIYIYIHEQNVHKPKTGRKYDFLQSVLTIFSVTIIKRYNLGKLLNKVFNWVYGSRRLESRWWREGKAQE